MGDELGNFLALSDNRTILAVGALFNDASVGHVRVFAWTGTDCIQRGKDLLGSSPRDEFGDSVSLSSDGSIGVDQTPSDGPGYVRVKSTVGAVQLGSNKAPLSLVFFQR